MICKLTSPQSSLASHNYTLHKQLGGCRKDFRSGPAVIGAHEAHTQFLKWNRQKSRPAKTGPAGPAPAPMLELVSKFEICI